MAVTLTASDDATRESAFRDLLRARLDHSYGLAGLLLGNAAEAEDVVGDALEIAWKRYDQLHTPASFAAWFDRIVVNLCRDRRRRSRIIRFVALQTSHPDPADPFVMVLEKDRIGRAMRRLSVDERTVIVLHFWDDLTLDTIADRLAWPPGTVRSRLNRALQRIRDEIDVKVEAPDL